MVSRAPQPSIQRTLAGAKLAFAVVGVLIWAYGLRTDNATVRWLGIAFLAIAFLLRFIRRRPGPDE